MFFYDLWIALFLVSGFSTQETTSEVHKQDPVFVQEIPQYDEYVLTGDTVQIGIPIHYGHTQVQCQIETPEQYVIQLKPDYDDYRDDVTVLDGKDCAVIVGPVSVQSTGTWIISARILDSLNNLYVRQRRVNLKVIEVNQDPEPTPAEELEVNPEDDSEMTPDDEVDVNHEDDHVTTPGDDSEIIPGDELEEVDSEDGTIIPPEDDSEIPAGGEFEEVDPEDVPVTTPGDEPDVNPEDDVDITPEPAPVEDVDKPEEDGNSLIDIMSVLKDQELEPVYTLSENEIIKQVQAGAYTEIEIDEKAGHTELYCFVRYNEVTYELKPEINNTRADVEVDETTDFCKVIIGPVTDDNSGEWLIVTWNRDSLNMIYERKLPFYIHNLDVRTKESSYTSNVNSLKRFARSYEVYEPELIESHESLEIYSGNSVTLTAYQEYGHSIAECYLITNNGDTIEFIPYNNNTRDNITLLPVSMVSECSIRLDGFSNSNVGTWSLVTVNMIGSIQYERLVHYSLTLFDDSEENPIGSSQVLTAESSSVTAISGDNVIMRCNIDTTIQYCWFRANNGTVYSLSPASEHSAKDNVVHYIGEGFEAGECGMLISSVSVEDTGAWTCNVGAENTIDPSVTIQLTVLSSPIVVTHESDTSRNILVVSAKTYDGSSLEYCRLVSPAGVGISDRSYDEHFTFDSTRLQDGVCTLRVNGYKSSHLGLWSVYAMRVGDNYEIYGTTHFYPFHGISTFGSILIFMLMLTMTLILVLLLVSVIVSHRDMKTWAYNRMMTVRSSISKTRTLDGPVLSPEELNETNTSGPPPYTQPTTMQATV